MLHKNMLLLSFEVKKKHLFEQNGRTYALSTLHGIHRKIPILIIHTSHSFLDEYKRFVGGWQVICLCT